MGLGYKIWRPRIPLLLRLCLLQFDNLSKYCYQLKPGCSNTTIYGRVFIFKLQHRAAFSYYLVLSWCLMTKWLWEHSLSHIILTWIDTLSKDIAMMEWMIWQEPHCHLLYPQWLFPLSIGGRNLSLRIPASLSCGQAWLMEEQVC